MFTPYWLDENEEAEAKDLGLVGLGEDQREEEAVPGLERRVITTVLIARGQRDRQLEQHADGGGAVEAIASYRSSKMSRRVPVRIEHRDRHGEGRRRQDHANRVSYRSSLAIRRCSGSTTAWAGSPPSRNSRKAAPDQRVRVGTAT